MLLADAIQFLSSTPDTSLLYQTSYNPGLIIASIFIAILGSYAALKAASHVLDADRSLLKMAWISVGAIAMGSGIWAMHFVGMLSLNLPCQVSYAPTLTLLSMVPSVLASGVALNIIGNRVLGEWSLWIGSVLLGAGIGIMHYSGMAAMRLEGFVRYDPTLFVLSLLVAVFLAYFALRVRVQPRRGHDLLGATIMGGAVSGMHYTAMRASYFLRGDVSSVSASTFDSTYLAMAIIIVASLVTLLAIVAAIAYRNLGIARREERWRMALEGAGEGVWDWNLATNKVRYSRSWKEMLGYADNEIGDGFEEWEKRVHPDDIAQAKADIEDYLGGRKPVFINENRMQCKDGSWRWILTRGSVMSRDSNGKALRMVGTHADISDRKRAERREHSRNELLEMLSKGAALPELLKAAVLSVETYNPNMLCSILLLDKEGKHLFTAAAPSLPDAYNDAISGESIGMNVGSCGTAAFTGQRVIVEDIQTHPYWADYKVLAATAGLRSCWSEPVRSTSGKILGTFAIYQHGVSSPNADDFQLIEQTARLIGVAIDQSNANAELQLASLVYQNSGEAMMVTDASGIIIGINPAFTNLTGYTLNDIIGKDQSILNSSRHDEVFYQNIREAINTAGHWQGEVWNLRKNGETFAELLTVNTIFNEDGSPHRRVALFSDITERKKSEELIWHQANFDALTSLPNRRMFQDRLDQEIKKSHRGGLPCALLFLDIDHFKEVNDVLGHDVGDMLLKEASHRLSSSVRGSDTIARLGGDEFTVILSELEDFDNVERVACEILRKLAEPFDIGTQMVYSSISIGITFYPQDATDVETLIKNADQAMYAAKSQGRNRHVYFTASMQETVQARMRMTNNLRNAIAGQEFRVFYQPIINLMTGTIGKAEALIRWQHPSLGCINPAEFIPIAEDTSLIIEIGDWVFRQAAAQAEAWRARFNKEFQISVNKSPVQLRNETGVHIRWAQYLKQHNLSGQSIVVEITEGLLLDANATVSNKLLEYRDAGLQVAIDDFGTGYSSLSYLKKFDIDYIKIDQSFVANLSPGSSDMVLCEAMIVMAHKLGMKVVAEGIETSEQLTLLTDAGCDYGQGFLFSKPIPADEFEQLLSNEQTLTQAMR